MVCALTYSCIRNYIEVTKLLLENRANIEVRDEEGNTPLILASKWGSSRDVIKILIENGADLEVKNNDGNYYTKFLNDSKKKEIEEFIQDIQSRKRTIKPCRK